MSLVKQALTEQECKEMVLETATPEATETKENRCQFQQKPLWCQAHAQAQIQHHYRHKEATLHALDAAALTCGIKKFCRYFCSLSSDHSKTASPERREDQKGGRSISWQKRTQLASPVGQHCGNTTLLYQHQEPGLLLRDKSWLGKPQ